MLLLIITPNASSQNVFVPLLFVFFLSLQLANIKNLDSQNCFNLPLMAKAGGMWALLTLCYISNGLGHMTNMAAMPIYGKNIKKIFSAGTKQQMTRNQEADDLETWYTALGMRVLPMFSCDGPGLTLTIFMTGSDFFPNASAWVKAYTALSALVFPSLF